MIFYERLGGTAMNKQELATAFTDKEAAEAAAVLFNGEVEEE
ncbi:hypothetical protein D927_03084 [Enterococcus faecalis 02-MB-BW-10]|nr:hypothetical protein D927_03084 [Enterococcus faecalis 02-MB-BW-10]